MMAIRDRMDPRIWQASATRMSLRDISIGMSDEVSAGSTITCWPNPATDQVHITYQGLTTEQGTIRVFDASGRLIDELSLQNGTTSIAHLAEGWYQAVVVDPKGRSLGVGSLVKVR